jgi:NAD(P)H-nitrite reductase large subunit
MIICSCKGVTKSEIIKAVKGGAQNIVDIQMLTKASTGCGRCKGIIHTILSKELEKLQEQNSQLRINFD